MDNDEENQIQQCFSSFPKCLIFSQLSQLDRRGSETNKSLKSLLCEILFEKHYSKFKVILRCNVQLKNVQLH